MPNQPNYFKIGIFVIAAFFLLAGGLVFLGAGDVLRPRVYFETYLDGTVQGIDIGSAVKFRGVPIGRVSRIDFCFNEYGPPPAGSGRQDYVFIEMEVNVPVFKDMFTGELSSELEQAVEQGLRVMLQPQGITGLNFLELNYVAQPDRVPPLPIWWTPRHFYIPSAPGTLTSLLDSVNKIIDTFGALDVKDTVKQAGEALDGFGNTMRNFDRRLDEMKLAEISGDLQKLLVDLQSKVDQLPVEQLSSDGRKTMESLSAASREMGTLVRTVQSSPLLDADAMNSVVADMQAAAANFRALSENLRQYPSQLFFSAPPKRSPFDPAKTRR